MYEIIFQRWMDLEKGETNVQQGSGAARQHKRYGVRMDSMIDGYMRPKRLFRVNSELSVTCVRIIKDNE